MSSRSILSRPVRTAALAALVVGATFVSIAPATATMGCGEYSFGFEGTRLLNDGISNTAGPFSIDLPQGTYDVIVQSHDAHSEHPGQLDQVAEQWYFELDSGYTSPLTSDVPDDRDQIVDEWLGQELAAASSITLRHRGEGSVNSVDPICVGFTAVTVSEPVPVDVPEIEEPLIAGPTVPARPVVEAPKQVITPPASIAPTVTVEVKAVVEVAETAAVAPAVEPQLALTGPSSSAAFLITGAVLIAVGAAFVLEERRRLAN